MSCLDQGYGAVTFLVDFGSGEAIRLRLRLQVKLFGGSGSGSGQNVSAPGADPGFLPGEGAKGLMTLYGVGMSDF